MKNAQGPFALLQYILLILNGWICFVNPIWGSIYETLAFPAEHIRGDQSQLVKEVVQSLPLFRDTYDLTIRLRRKKSIFQGNSGHSIYKIRAKQLANGEQKEYFLKIYALKQTPGKEYEGEEFEREMQVISWRSRISPPLKYSTTISPRGEFQILTQTNERHFALLMDKAKGHSIDNLMRKALKNRDEAGLAWTGKCLDFSLFALEEMHERFTSSNPGLKYAERFLNFHQRDLLGKLKDVKILFANRIFQKKFLHGESLIKFQDLERSSLDLINHLKENPDRPTAVYNDFFHGNAHCLLPEHDFTSPIITIYDGHSLVDSFDEAGNPRGAREVDYAKMQVKFEMVMVEYGEDSPEALVLERQFYQTMQKITKRQNIDAKKYLLFERIFALGELRRYGNHFLKGFKTKKDQEKIFRMLKILGLS